MMSKLGLQMVLISFILTVSPWVGYAADPQKPGGILSTVKDRPEIQKSPKKKPIGLKFESDDPVDKLFANQILQLKKRVRELEAQVVNLQKLTEHRHKHEDMFMAGNYWVSLKFLRTAINDDKSHLIDNYGVYFRSKPFKTGYKPSTKWTEKSAY